MLDRTSGIAKTLPPGISAAEEAAFWSALDQLRADYAALVEARKQRPAKAELMQWKQKRKLLDRLGTGWRDPDMIAALKLEADTHIEGYSAINESKGKSGLPTLFLYPAVLDLWCVTLQQPLKYSRSGADVYGPLIIFFLAVVKPILGAKTPTASGIAAIIDRKREGLDPEYRAMRQCMERCKREEWRARHTKSNARK
jgi:hypothetical protein